MKKTIVIVILAVFIASIAIVNFFGLEIKQFDSITYVSAIQCDTVIFHGDNSKELSPTQYAGKDGNIPVFEFNFIPADESDPYTLENLVNNPNIIQINYGVNFYAVSTFNHILGRTARTLTLLPTSLLTIAPSILLRTFLQP